MLNAKHSFKRVVLFAMTWLVFLSLGAIYAGENAADLITLLSEKDKLFNGGYTIAFIMAKKANMLDPNQGMVFIDCEATFTKDVNFAMKMDYNYQHPPIYTPPESYVYKPFDYDEEGNLIVWRRVKTYVLSNPDRNDTLEELEVFFVDSEVKLVDKGKNTNISLLRFPIGSPDNTYLFDQFKLAIGSGFSEHLGKVVSVKTLPVGFLEVTSQGSHGPALQGRWELTLDPNSDYLVREATFTMDGMDRPSIVTTSSGVVEKDGIKLARYGTFKYSNLLDISVEVTGISKVVGPNKLYDEVLSRLNAPLPRGSQIMDRRGDKPIISTVE